MTIFHSPESLLSKQCACVVPSPVTCHDRARLLLPLLVLLASLTACKKEAQVAAAAQPVPVRVTTVHLMPASSVGRYPAVVRPRIEADIGFRVGGKVIERHVDVGDHVVAGTVLARLDPTDFDLQVRAVEAQLISATADAQNAHDDFVRYAHLYKDGWTARQDYDKHHAAMETTDAKVKQYEAQLRAVRDDSQYTTLVSEGAGVVTSVALEQGQVVAQGQTVLKIARPGELEVAADIPEAQIALLEQAALSVELWSMPGVSVAGRLREISPNADPVTRTYRVRITLEDPPLGTQFGMTATLVATWQRKGQVARLPLTALTQDGTDAAVWVLNPAADGIVLRPVTVGDYTGTEVDVLGGLNDGERVVTAGVHKLYAAQKIRPWTEPVR
jgi:membrane fusion protein, multidrug efflux system